MKKCSKCKLVKSLDNFGKHKYTKDGMRCWCKECCKESKKKYFTEEENKIKNRDYSKNYRILNKEIVLEKKKVYNNSIEGKLKTKQQNKKYKDKHKAELSIKANLFIKNKCDNDSLFKLKTDLRKNLGSYFKAKGYKKNTKTEMILGCTFEEFKLYIESKFEPWMNWNNYGKYTGKLNDTWQFDHIKPLAKAKSEEEIIKLNHYSNIQPLCSFINQNIKKDKYYGKA